MLSGCADLVALEERLGRLEQEMASGRYGPGDARRVWRRAGSARARRRIRLAPPRDAVVRGLGFTDGDLVRPLRTFSGGELTRGSLARTLAGDPDLLLLDEPTNHLDVASLEWLEEQPHHGGCGDRAGRARSLVPGGGWHGGPRVGGGPVAILRRPVARLAQGEGGRELALQRTVERQQAEIERLERFVSRFRAGTRSRQAQARVKKLAKIDRLEHDRRAGGARGFKFKEAARSGRVALELEGATIAAGERKLLDGAELWLERGEHVTLVGPNGAGKTTLIETLAGRSRWSTASCDAATTSSSASSPSTPRRSVARARRSRPLNARPA